MEMYEVGDHVYVKATPKQVKIHQAVASWTIQATIEEKHFNGMFYRLRWDTSGLGGEAAGEVSKRAYHWSNLKRRPNNGFCTFSTST